MGMSNDTIPATLTFAKPTRALRGDRAVNLKTNTEYKVLEVNYDKTYNDYGYVIRTKLLIQREGGFVCTLPWGDPEYVQC
jgi:hypothetical protein